MKKYIYLLLQTFIIVLISTFYAHATHNRAGEITYRNVPLPNQPYRYEITIITYTKVGHEDSDAADRDSLDVNFGDGTIQQAPRVNGINNKGEVVAEGIQKNIYLIFHSYAGPFNYVISVLDPNRIDNIINIKFGDSVNIPFFLQDTIFFRDPQFFGYNSSPVLLQPPIDYGNVNYTFIHNPNAFDAEGDSLHFSLIPPKADLYTDVPVYQYPNQIQAGSDNLLTLNATTGELIWDSPQAEGIYNIAILIREFRNGIQIGSLMRDMQIIVKDLNNSPPKINAVKDTCLLIGQKLDLTIKAFDYDSPAQKVILTAWGGVFEVPQSPATFAAQSQLGNAMGSFEWQTDCSHIYSSPYTVVFKAEDNFKVGVIPYPLAYLETWQLTLVPPPTPNLQATLNLNDVVLTWGEHLCQNTPKFLGFSVWRAIGCDTTVFDKCTKTLQGSNYIKIASQLKTNTYTDPTAVRGLTYSYRIVAEFADAFTDSQPPIPFNIIHALPSESVCIELPRNLPIITNVSIQTTATANGSIYIAWSKPRIPALDTLQFAPPYTYTVQYATAQNPNLFETATTLTAATYAQANDTTFVHTANALNTEQQPFVYKIDFWANNNTTLVGSTEKAQSVFVTTTPNDNQLTLQWTTTVPWINSFFVIYKKNELLQTWDSIGFTAQNVFIDENLKNGQKYCYKIKAVGSYFTTGLLDPLINFSQEVCDIPIDKTPPCPPLVVVTNPCLSNTDILKPEDLKNTITWNYFSEEIPYSCFEDVLYYYIYYRPLASNTFEKLDSVTATTYNHFTKGSLAGCYAVAAVDSFLNVSDTSAVVCIENCFEYELPNAFTPNADQQNDLYTPRKNIFVSSIDLKIFNRWGQIVFETKDPQINWDGNDQKTNQALAEGVYFYTCDILEPTGTPNVNIVKANLSGYIHLLRKM